jgi:LCP family protein required for cell wall assembly
VPPTGRPDDQRDAADPGGIRRSGPIPPLPGRPPVPGDGAPRGPGGRSRKATRAGRRAAATPGRRRAVRAVVALVAVVGVVALYHLGLYFYVDRSMTRVAVLAPNGPEVLARQLQAGDQTYLVVGNRVPGQKGPGSVAMLLASLSADGRRAVLLTVPPTALVDTPECRTQSGRLREPRTEPLAASLLDGAPACTVRAVQQLSGLRIDHYLALDLSRLPSMVDALGGVPVCVAPSAAVSAASRPLPAGGSRLSGSAASAYLRPAKAGADAAGTEVAQRVQLLLTSTLRAATSLHTLTDPVTLTRFLTRAAGAVTVDDGTTLGDLRGLGSSLGGLSGGAVQRADLPLTQDGSASAGTGRPYVLLDGAATRSVFDSVIDRTRLPAGYGATRSSAATGPGEPGAAGAGDASPSPAAAPAPAPAAGGVTVAPRDVTVDVLNGTGTSGLAATVAAALRQQGFAGGTVGNAPAAVAQTTVRYGPQAQDKARTVAAAVPGAVLEADPAAGGSVQLVIGPNYSSVVPVQLSPPTSAAPSAPAASTAAAAKAGPAVACG